MGEAGGVNYCELGVGGIGTRPSISMWLMYHDPGVRQAVSELLLSGCQQECSHAAGLSHTPRGHWRLDVLHGVIDTQSSSH